MALPRVYLTCNKGVSKGDPESPLLFRLTEEVLSRGLSKLLEEGQITHISSPGECTPPSHCLFTNDIFIFCRTDSNSLRQLIEFSDWYEQTSAKRCETGTKPSKCTTCGGQGQVVSSARTPLDVFQQVMTSSSCNGTGEVCTPCNTCSGDGRVRRTKRISLKVPAGVDTGNV
ncbi:hypothetical protein Pint_10144 [Pistacia integerrima]|uniref:Uncharacterized protein n=1 Tax=Pistacia integerrima TaxID=434235 RepID=A0ACC0XEN5_9ROSI|nr:hypothetical protein Pint_10144 [Pistacia integerrima]